MTVAGEKRIVSRGEGLDGRVPGGAGPCVPDGDGLVSASRIDPGYEFFETTADKGILARGRDLPELFANAARGLAALMVEDPRSIRPSQRRPVRVTGAGREGLLVAWLNELLYLHETEGFLAAEPRIVALAEEALEAEVLGEGFDPSRHRLTGHVKAATYHGLEIARDERGWRAPIIVDV